MDERQKMYLRDTIAILYDYDGMQTPEGLKDLIDGCRARLKKLLLNNISDEDLGV